MNAIGQRLRAVILDTADEITPDGVPPLRLPPGQPGAVRAGGTPRWRLLAPLGAAAAVIVIVVAALALAGGPPRPGPRPAAVTGPAAGSGSVPPYYVALNLVGNGDCCRPGLPYSPPTDAVVRATATGAALATITPPWPYGTFIGISGAADDRTFVLAAQEVVKLPLGHVPPTALFLLRIDPANPVPGARAQLTPLPIRVPANVLGLALTPDGSKLAVAEGVFGASSLHVVTVATGAERVWDGQLDTFGPGAGGDLLSWVPDGRTVAFVSLGVAVRLLDTSAAGSSLLANSRLVLSGPKGDVFDYWRQVMLTDGGQIIIAVIELAEPVAAPVRQELVTISARTGRLLHVLNRIPVYGGYEQVLWASPSGQALIVSGTQRGTTVGPFNVGATAGVLRHGRFTPIPWSDRTFAAAW